MYFVQILDQIH